jgi:hypothetical protein
VEIGVRGFAHGALLRYLDAEVSMLGSENPNITYAQPDHHLNA